MSGGYGCIILHRRSNVQNIFSYSLHFLVFFVTSLRYVNQRFPKSTFPPSIPAVQAFKNRAGRLQNALSRKVTKSSQI